MTPFGDLKERKKKKKKKEERKSKKEKRKKKEEDILVCKVGFSCSSIFHFCARLRHSLSILVQFNTKFMFSRRSKKQFSASVFRGKVPGCYSFNRVKDPKKSTCTNFHEREAGWWWWWWGGSGESLKLFDAMQCTQLAKNPVNLSLNKEGTQ